MAIHGAARDRVIARLEKCATFGKETTGASLRGELLPKSINRGEYPYDNNKGYDDLPRSEDVQYVVYSYSTPIAWVLKSGYVVVPSIHYSDTTSRHQTFCRVHLAKNYRF